jgi:hypothetical protein
MHAQLVQVCKYTHACCMCAPLPRALMAHVGGLGLGSVPPALAGRFWSAIRARPLYAPSRSWRLGPTGIWAMGSPTPSPMRPTMSERARLKGSAQSHKGIARLNPVTRRHFQR